MAKLSLLLAVSQLSLVYSLPASNIERQADAVRERAVTISTNLEATTSYSTAIQTLQTPTLTTRPPAEGVRLSRALFLQCLKINTFTDCPNWPSHRWRYYS